MKFAIAFWLIETVFFILRDGWHWEASCDAEKLCDSGVELMATIGIVYLLLAISEIIEKYIKYSSVFGEDKFASWGVKVKIKELKKKV